MEAWKKLKSECSGCTRCELCKTRRNLVFGIGNESAEIMLVGEGPGEQEDIQGEPFVGPAGQLLDTMLELIDLDRSRVYIANIVKCRPPQNRDPLPEEQEACIEWLRAQVALIRPKIIVCLGRVAACQIINKDFKVTKEHGQFFERNGVLLMGTLHPAAVLRDPRKKGEWFADFVTLRDKIREVCDHTDV